jgi:preprotein translocase subunit SecD
VLGARRRRPRRRRPALDSQLITVPVIDYKTYPDGLMATNGAELTSGLTVTSAGSLAAELRLGALPLNLKLMCVGAPATPPCRIPRVR